MATRQRVWKLSALIFVALIVLVACGHHGRAPQPLQLPASPTGTPETASPGGVEAELPGVLSLDSLFGESVRSVSNGAQVISMGADVMDAEGNYEVSGTKLNLRAIELGAYSYAVYGQDIGEDPKPISSLIDTDYTNYGGGQDEDIPASYLVGIADYSVGSWRWFGPFGDVDVNVQVNSETLKSRFKSPGNKYYLVILAVNASKAASVLPADGLVADWPLAGAWRVTSAEGEDPGGVLIEEILTDTAPGDTVDTEPAVVTGLSASADESGVTLSWDTNPDPDVDIYQVFRDDLDDSESSILLNGVLSPAVTYTDTTGVPGKEYQYGVRARNNVGYGAQSFVNAIRSMEAPDVIASNNIGDHIEIQWTAIEGAVGYKLYRGETDTFGEAELLAELDAVTTSYSDMEPPVGAMRYYWVRASGDDIEGPLGGPDSGCVLEDGSIALIPDQAIVSVGDSVRVQVYVGNTAHPLRYLSSVHIQFPNNILALDTSSFNVGAPGGSMDDMDGFWAPFDSTLLLGGSFTFQPYDADYSGAPANTSFVEVCLAPTHGTYVAPAGSSGVLFNFLFNAVAEGEATIRIVDEYTYGATTFPATFYSDDGVTKYSFEAYPATTIMVVPGTGASSLRKDASAGGSSESPPASSTKTASAPPTGAYNSVDDLVVTDNGDGTYTFEWSYVNVGDCDQDRMVRASDFVPIAMHFAELADPSNEWIDLNQDGIINISETTLLVSSLWMHCDGYEIQGSSDEAGPFSTCLSVSFDDALGSPTAERLHFQTTSPQTLTWWRVVPFDWSHTLGIPSAVAHVS